VKLPDQAPAEGAGDAGKPAKATDDAAKPADEAPRPAKAKKSPRSKK
jgi:hypothetical protein